MTVSDAILAVGAERADGAKNRMTDRARTTNWTAGLAWGCLALGIGSGGVPAMADSFRSQYRMGPAAVRSEQIVTQAEWATQLVEVLGLSPALSDDAPLEDVFDLLCPAVAGRGSDVESGTAMGGSSYHTLIDVPKQKSPSDPLRMTVSLPSPAVYMLSVEGSGPQRWVVDQKVVGHLDPSELGLAQASEVVPLRRGPHEITAFLSHEASAERVELSAYTPLCIEPAEGWRSDRPLNHGDRARTIVRALGIEQRLPESGEPIVVEAEAYANASAWGVRTHRKLATPASDHTWVTAEGSPAEFTYRINLEDPSVFTLEGLLHGASPQIWSIDGRYRLTVKPGEGAEGFAPTEIVTLPLAAGEHVIRALIPPDSGIDLIRLVRRKSRANDYLNLIEEAGFRARAPAAYVTRSVAYQSLTNPTFTAHASRFLDQVAGRPPMLLVEHGAGSVYSQPLSAMLPPEL
jgi:hypothetical protein